ncbi:hydrolase [Pseudomonas sp. FW215-R2]|uniref:isochorismatase family protein n=1 Tax=unclassified Pseudomonas TaxID=196821 RepID=UPI000C886E1E|nr:MULTISPECIES: cysteine hydrolase family protein [unclassified Pseudomonas]PMX03394.1 hydrolase [Pseudomonas sp. FW215-R2]PMX12792.1 hydrolase [Pseudomonas sp. FW215-L1]PMX25050.1 hydrolase [Pseudomonas sp. FW215-E1]PNA29296.1 hydrolase [Pseudomonas sp. FW215-R4]
MRQALLIIDVQPCFSPPPWLVDGIRSLIGTLPSVATVERHDESRTPFQRQLGWHPAPDDDSLIEADRIFIKYGYAPSPDTIDYLKSLNLDRVLVCGLQTETCCLAAGFALFDAGLQPTLLTDLTVGSSLDRSGRLGVKLWEHHFKHTLTSSELRACLQAS